MSNLKSCPHCGEKDQLILDIHPMRGMSYLKEGWVECTNCGARGPTEYGNCEPDDMERLLIYGWNNRAKPYKDVSITTGTTIKVANDG